MSKPSELLITPIAVSSYQRAASPFPSISIAVAKGRSSTVNGSDRSIRIRSLLPKSGNTVLPLLSPILAAIAFCSCVTLAIVAGAVGATTLWLGSGTRVREIKYFRGNRTSVKANYNRSPTVGKTSDSARISAIEGVAVANLN